MEGEVNTMRAGWQIAKCQEESLTVGQNLDRRIAAAKEELARLEASRESLAPLLNMRIQDIRSAMQY